MNNALLATWLGIALTGSAATLSAQTNFATLTSDGAWTWYNDSRALFHNGKLYFGFVRATDSKTTLAVFDLLSGTTTNLWTSGFTQLDDHDNPGLLAKQDGRLLAVYSRHISDQYFSYRTSSSTNPVAASGWNAELSIPNSGASMTYANPFQLSSEGGKIYNFCRNQNFNPTVFTSTDGGTNWSAAQLLIQTGTGGTIRPYVKYAANGTNRIDFLYTDGHPRDVTNSLYHLFYQGGAFYKTDGTLVKNYASLPILHDAGERGSVIYQYSDANTSDPNDHIPTGRAWCWETAFQSNAAPVCVFTVQRDLVTGTNSGADDRIYYYYARWTGTNWQKRFIAQAGRPLYAVENDYAGGICLDPQDANTIYISSNAQNPFNLTDTTNVALSASQRYELWRGGTTNGGLNFTWSQITSNSTVDNLRPYVPRRNGGEPCVLWFRGSYSSYTSYACNIVGLFTTQVPNVSQPPATPPLTYLDAASGAGGNTTLAGGSTFSPPLNGTTGADNLWEQRTPFASGGNVFEAGGETAENAPELKTTISGLVPGMNYSIYVHFWDPTSTTEDWNIRAGFTSNPGGNTLYAAADATSQLGATAAVLASTLTYTSAPTIFSESGRALLAGWVGTAKADSAGKIEVFVDDLPSLIGANNRTWYDGLAYAAVVATTPPTLMCGLNAGTLTLSWPPDHTGWKLQVQSNSPSAGPGTNWAEIPNTSTVNIVTNIISPGNGSVYYRLVY